MLKSEFYLKIEEIKNKDYKYIGLIIINEEALTSELIINHNGNLDYKVSYIEKAYNEKMELKANNNIYIIDVTGDNDMSSIEKVYNTFITRKIL